MENEFSWRNLAKIEPRPGVYAWYYKPQLAIHDIEEAVEAIESMKVVNKLTRAAEYTSSFLAERVFKFFNQDPYEVRISGPLKPRFEGTINHLPNQSGTLIDRIVEQPDMLYNLKFVLDQSTPLFSSPIYIGMSDNLKTRILHHKKGIKDLREKTGTSTIHTYLREPKSFASQVVSRKMSPQNLIVYCSYSDEERREYLDAENILNRINLPILGSN